MLADQRAAITAALVEITGVNALSSKPRTPNLRDAWCDLEGLTRGPGMTLEAAWRVWVFLGQDEVTAREIGDSLVEPLFEGLDEVAFVDGLAYVNVPTSAGDVVALEARVRCEG